MKRFYPAVALAALLAVEANAQFSEGGLPWSMRHQMDAAFVPVVRTSGIDRPAVDAEDARRAEAGVVPSDARMLEVNADLATSGVWHTLPNGDGVWRLRVESPGALGTELFFRDFHMPIGGLLHVYSADGTEVLGGFSGYHNKDNGVFATAALKGEACYVEYFEPASARGEGRFVIASLGHTYRHLGPDRADDCEVDVNCPEGAPWVPQRDGVVKLRIVMAGAIFFCSGGLVNNVSQDCARYVLTANHCSIDENGDAVTAADLLLWKFYFGYQRAACGTGSASQSHVKTGCVKRAESNDNGGDSGSDFFLVELDDEITASWNPYWLGWDATTNAHAGGIGIHHPAGDEKKISTFTGSAQNSSQWNGMSTHYRVTWSQTESGWGVTEGGSSGSPLFESNGRVIGTLTGGGSFCNSVQPGGQTQPDYYGRMNYHWTSNGTPANERLKTFLDPDNTGTLTMDGTYEPCVNAVAEYATLERPLLAPNPATENVRITFPTGIVRVDRVDLLDITGKVVASQGVANGATNANVAVDRLSAGSYFARLFADGSFLPAVLFEVIER